MNADDIVELKQAVYLLRALGPFLGYQSIGNEFEPNREQVDATTERLEMIIHREDKLLGIAKKLWNEHQINEPHHQIGCDLCIQSALAIAKAEDPNAL